MDHAFLLAYFNYLKIPEVFVIPTIFVLPLDNVHV